MRGEEGMELMKGDEWGVVKQGEKRKKWEIFVEEALWAAKRASSQLVRCLI